MPTMTQEKAQTGFNKNKVIDFAVKNLKEKNLTSTIKTEEVEQQINETIEKLMDRTGGITAREIGARLSNIYGKVSIHFSFDGNRPFTPEEKQKYNLMGHSEKELIKALNKIRMMEKKKAKAKWDESRREEISLFRQYFSWYLNETRGLHKRNKMDVIVGVGDDISYKDGHYKKIY